MGVGEDEGETLNARRLELKAVLRSSPDRNASGLTSFTPSMSVIAFTSETVEWYSGPRWR